MTADRETFTDLVDRHGAAVAGLLRRLCRNAHDADDLFQEVAVKVWRNLGDRPPVRNTRGWLLTIAYRCFLDQTDRRRSHAPLRDDEPPADPAGETPASRAEQAERCDRLAAAVAGLSPAHREIIALHYAGGLSLREVAAATGLSVGTVKSRLSAGLEQLRKRLA